MFVETICSIFFFLNVFATKIAFLEKNLVDSHKNAKQDCNMFPPHPKTYFTIKHWVYTENADPSSFPSDTS